MAARTGPRRRGFLTNRARRRPTDTYGPTHAEGSAPARRRHEPAAVTRAAARGTAPEQKKPGGPAEPLPDSAGPPGPPPESESPWSLPRSSVLAYSVPVRRRHSPRGDHQPQLPLVAADGRPPPRWLPHLSRGVDCRRRYTLLDRVDRTSERDHSGTRRVVADRSMNRCPRWVAARDAAAGGPRRLPGRPSPRSVGCGAGTGEGTGGGCRGIGVAGRPGVVPTEVSRRAEEPVEPL